MAEELQNQEGMDITISHSMGFDSYQREKTFDSISLKGDVHQTNDIRLVMVYKDLMKIYLQVSTYLTLKETLLLEDKAIIDKGDGSKTKTVEEANEYGYQNRLAGLAVTLDRLGDTLDSIEDELKSEVDKQLFNKTNDLFGYIQKFYE